GPSTSRPACFRPAWVLSLFATLHRGQGRGGGPARARTPQGSPWSRQSGEAPARSPDQSIRPWQRDRRSAGGRLAARARDAGMLRGHGIDLELVLEMKATIAARLPVDGTGRMAVARRPDQYRIVEPRKTAGRHHLQVLNAPVGGDAVGDRDLALLPAAA